MDIVRITVNNKNQVLVTSPQTKKNDERSASRKVESGWAVLDNNGVNVLMAALMSFGGIAVAGWMWSVPLQSTLKYWL